MNEMDPSRDWPRIYKKDNLQIQGNSADLPMNYKISTIRPYQFLLGFSHKELEKMAKMSLELGLQYLKRDLEADASKKSREIFEMIKEYCNQKNL